MMEAIKRILIADAGEDFRRGLVDSLSGEADIQVAGQTGDGAELVRMVSELMPDAVVMEIVLAGLDGLEVLEQLNKMEKRPKILVLSNYTRGGIADAAAAKGADYFMVKPCRSSALCERIRDLTGGTAIETEGDRGVDLEKQVTAIIHEVGVPAHIKGYQYLREAILIAVRDMDVINAVTKVLYPRSGQAVQYYCQPGRTGNPSCHRGGVGPGRFRDAAEILWLYRFQRQGKAHQQ